MDKSFKLPFTEIDNPFDDYKGGQPVKDKDMFYGRKDDLEQIISKITNKKGDILKGRALAIYGQKRTGKSSLLYHLEQKLREKDKYNIIVNLESIGTIGVKKSDIIKKNESDVNKGTDIKGFLYAILDELNNEVTKHNDLVNLLVQNNIEIDPDKILSNPEMCEVIFNRQFKGVCDIVHSCKRQIILMIDEFTYIYDWIKRGIITDQIMKFWKGLLQNNGIFAVIVGQDNMESFVGDPRFSNDFGTTYMQKVTYLDEKSAKELMSEPILDSEGKSRYTEDALDYLYELTSGSAFLIMKLCAGLVDYLNEIKSSSITKAHIEEYLRNNWGKINEFDYFGQQYNDVNQDNELNEKNKDIIRKIAFSSNSDGWAKINDIAVSIEDKELLDILNKRDVVEIIKGKCKIKVELYRQWILANVK